MTSSSESTRNYVFAPSDKEKLIAISEQIMIIQQTIQKDRFHAVFNLLDDTRTKIMQMAENLSTWSTSNGLQTF